MENVSGRNMKKYYKTKSDPICKWRVASVSTVVELVGILPKKEMAKEDFRNYMSDFYNGAFFRTPYQLALQLGLYYEDDKKYIPRFDHHISEQEAFSYMQKWMSRYYVPNPFTKKGFINVTPAINLQNGIAQYLENHPNKPNLATAGAALFGGTMGNIGCVKYVIKEFSNILSVDENNDLYLLSNEYGEVNVNINRDDKMAFFNRFN